MDWNTRFSTQEYLFGTEPAAFLLAQGERIRAPARVLCVADGEGRNSVYLAQLGHRVTAFDVSPNAVEKARRLAAAAGVTLDLNVSRIEDWDWSQRFDAVVAVFIQFMGPEPRKAVFAGLAEAVRPGGLLLVHGYAPRQIGYGTGGPPDPANMYTEALLHGAFAGWEVLHSADYDAVIDEGLAHSGRSALVDFVARRPSH